MPEKKLMRPKVDYMTAIFDIIKDRCNYSDEKAEDFDIIRNRVFLRGYKEEELNNTLEIYENLNVIMMEDGNRLRLLI